MRKEKFTPGCQKLVKVSIISRVHGKPSQEYEKREWKGDSNSPRDSLFNLLRPVSDGEQAWTTVGDAFC